MKRSLIVTKSLLIAFISFLFIYGCSASTGSRYEKDKTVNTTETKNGETKPSTLKEDFDITPYKTEIVIPERKLNGINENGNVWFDYGSPEIETKAKTLVGTGDGFRVLVLTTDNIEEANQIKADVYFSQNTNEVYIDLNLQNANLYEAFARQDDRVYCVPRDGTPNRTKPQPTILGPY